MAEPFTYGTTMPGTLLGGGVPEYNVYAASDGWVAVAALEPHFKKRLEEALEMKTVEEYQAVFRQKNADYWQEWGREKDVPIVVVQ